MASYTTKFSVNDTAYVVDSSTMNVYPGTIVAIYLNHFVSSSAPTIAYEIKFFNESIIVRKSKYNESELYYVEEAKATLIELLNQRTADTESLH
jgi:hypothetical protein